jgi:hypothetical protein
MARQHQRPDPLGNNLPLAARLVQLRTELFGRGGAPKMAELLGIPSGTWINCELGVTVPAEVILKVLALTSVEPRWLATGEGRILGRVRNQLGVVAAPAPAHASAPWRVRSCN